MLNSFTNITNGEFDKKQIRLWLEYKLICESFFFTFHICNVDRLSEPIKAELRTAR